MGHLIFRPAPRFQGSEMPLVVKFADAKRMEMVNGGNGNYGSSAGPVSVRASGWDHQIQGSYMPKVWPPHTSASCLHFASPLTDLLAVRTSPGAINTHHHIVSAFDHHHVRQLDAAPIGVEIHFVCRIANPELYWDIGLRNI